jgi:hypothetical protein
MKKSQEKRLPPAIDQSDAIVQGIALILKDVVRKLAWYEVRRNKINSIVSRMQYASIEEKWSAVEKSPWFETGEEKKITHRGTETWANKMYPSSLDVSAEIRKFFTLARDDWVLSDNYSGLFFENDTSGDRNDTILPAGICPKPHAGDYNLIRRVAIALAYTQVKYGHEVRG